MEQFSLDKYLENPSRKVVTRDGRPVRIICTDRKGKSGNIVGLVCEDESLIYVWNNDGKHMVPEIPDNDIFFADEEELTEFQNKLFSVISEIWQNYLLGREIDIAETVKEYSPELLDLARKELEKDNVIIDKDKYLEICDQYYNNGKKNALKDLPKWKKITEETNLALTLSTNGYYIALTDIENLPKEE